MDKKILCLDGGGAKGFFPASFLTSLEDLLEVKIVDYFDLIVGTSTGGIIALGLGLGLDAKDILEFYKQHVPEIFKKSIKKSMIGLFSVKHKGDYLKNALESVFGDKKLGHSRVRLVIPSVNLETGEVYIYKTCHNKRFLNDYKLSVVEVAMSTSAAASYLEIFKSKSGLSFIDGGIFCNNPIGLAAVEAIKIIGWTDKEVKILSIGCTEEPLGVEKGRNSKWCGGLYWLKKIPEVFMKTQSFYAMGTAQLLIGKNNIFRISPVVNRGRFKIDDYEEMESLIGLGASEARQHSPEIKEVFFREKAEPFIPHRQLSI